MVGEAVVFSIFADFSPLGSIDACVKTEEFESLQRLGPKIIPFVVFKFVTDAEANLQGVFLCKSLNFTLKAVR